MKTKQETTLEANHSIISKLLNQKRELENLCEQKDWIWKETLPEHIELQKIDVKLQELGYDFCSN